MTDVAQFYDDLAHHYHLLFEDWDASMRRQEKALSALLDKEVGDTPLKILDAACGIGTQALGFAHAGHEVTGSDLSPAAIRRARHEAQVRNLGITFRVADLRVLSGYHAGPFDLVAVLDNALPHLENEEDMAAALREMASLLKPGGHLMASVRDYDALAREKPRATEPRIFGGGSERRVTFQIWDWRRDGRGYRIHQYILQHRGDVSVDTRVFTTTYWAWGRDDLNRLIEHAGLGGIRWVEPDQSGFHQPIVMARAG